MKIVHFVWRSFFWGGIWLKTKGQDLLAHIFMILGTIISVWCAIEYNFPFIFIFPCLQLDFITPFC